MPGPLTWQQVAAPNFSGSIEGYKTAGDLLDRGFSGLAGALGQYGQLLGNQNAAKLAMNAAQYADPAAAKAALANGDMFKGIDTSFLSPEQVQKFGEGRVQELLQQGLTGAQTSAQNADANSLNATAARTNLLAPIEARQGNATIAETGARTAGQNLQNTISGTDFGNRIAAGNIAAKALATGVDPQSALTAALNSGAPGAAVLGAVGAINGAVPSVFGASGSGSIGGAPSPGLVEPAPNVGAALGKAVGNAHVGGTTPDVYGAALANGDVASALRASEGLKTNAYWDVNHFRTGYGSDSITLPDGTTKEVTKDTTITPADAERDLQRRTAEYSKGASQAIGPTWDKFDAPTQAALTSMAYNYGHVPDDVVRAAKTGNANAIAEAITNHAQDNSGANYARRMTEAQAVLGQTGNSQDPAMQLRNDVLGSISNNAAATKSAQGGLAQSLAKGVAGTFDQSLNNSNYSVQDAIKDLKGASTTTTKANGETETVKGTGPFADYANHTLQDAIQKVMAIGDDKKFPINPALAKDLIIRHSHSFLPAVTSATGSEPALNLDSKDIAAEIDRMASKGTDGYFTQNQNNIRTSNLLSVANDTRQQLLAAHNAYMQAYNLKMAGRQVPQATLDRLEARTRQYQQLLDQATGSLAGKGPVLQDTPAKTQSDDAARLKAQQGLGFVGGSVPIPSDPRNIGGRLTNALRIASPQLGR